MTNKIHKLLCLLKRKILTSNFFVNVATLVAGTTIAQAIPVVISPIISRLYLPQDFGIFTIYLSISSITSGIATGKYEMAIMLPEKDEDAINVVTIAISLTFIVSALVLILILIFYDSLENFTNDNSMLLWIYFIPVMVFTTGIYQTSNYWFNRRKKYKKIAFSFVASSLITAILTIILGLKNVGALGLIISSLAGQIAATGYLCWKFVKSEFNIIKEVSLTSSLSNLSRYQDFPKYNAPQVLFDNLRDSSVVFLIPYFFGINILGYYSFALKILKKPLAVMGSSISQVFYQKIVQHYHDRKNIWSLSKSVIFKLLIFSLPISITVILFGPKMFGFLFGDNWKEAGAFAQILSCWVSINFIVSPLSKIPLILEKQKEFFWIGLSNNILFPMVILVTSSLNFNIFEVLISASLFGSIYLLLASFWIRKITLKFQTFIL